MSAFKFHPLRIASIREETADCISVAFEVPQELAATFAFNPGQYLTLRSTINGEELRRSYSICSGPADGELRVAIKKVAGGRFSTFANEVLKAGDVLDAMPPTGKFSPKAKGSGRHLLAFVSGSGITPVLSILKHTLEADATGSFTLVYGNKNRHSIIFREAIEGLKNKYLSRLRVYHVLSREVLDVPLFYGRIDAARCRQFCASLIDVRTMDEAFVCGPEEMILSVREELIALGMPAATVHMELFSSPDQPRVQHRQWTAGHATDNTAQSRVSVKLDGVTFDLDLAYNGDNILDAALRAGADLPYACKGGVCSTCRARVTEGEVEMEVNYALEADEVRNGYVLTCQSHPKTDRVVVDFDAR